MKHFRTIRHPLARAATLLGLIQCDISFANQWDAQGTLLQAVNYNDNISLNGPRPIAVFGYFLTPSFVLRDRTKAIDVTLNGAADIRRYNDPEWNCDNYNIGLDNTYRYSGRSTFDFHGSYGSTCSYSQQVSDTGILLPNLELNSLTLSPSWRWQWTQRSRLIAESGYTKSSFSSTGLPAINNIITGNETYRANLGLDYLWSRDASLNAGFSFSQIKYSGSQALTQTIFGIQGGLNYLIDQYWSASGGGGLRLIDSTEILLAPSEQQNTSQAFGYVANISIRRDNQSDHFSSGYSTALVPSSIGQTLQTHTIFINYSRSLSKSLRIDLSGTINRSESILSGATNNGGVGSFSRDYAAGSLGVAWAYSKNWSLRANYDFRWQRFPSTAPVGGNGSETASANTITLSVSYTLDEINGIH